MFSLDAKIYKMKCNVINLIGIVYGIMVVIQVAAHNSPNRNVILFINVSGMATFVIILYVLNLLIKQIALFIIVVFGIALDALKLFVQSFILMKLFVILMIFVLLMAGSAEN